MATAAQVKELRERSGAPMMDCKKALESTNGEMDAAIDWLRENGISKAAKKGDRIAREGLTRVLSRQNRAVMIELNSETDFVAKNEQFLDLLDKIASGILESDIKTLEDTIKLKINNETIPEIITNNAAIIGEKLNLRRIKVFIKKDDEIFGTYMHAGGKISSLVILQNGNDELAKQICLHIAATKPLFLREADVDPQLIATEKEILLKEAMNEGKTADIAEKMVIGRTKKYLQEICLENQQFVFDEKQTIKQLAGNSSSTIITFCRFEVGEGIEKKEENFAQEVMKQLDN